MPRRWRKAVFSKKTINIYFLNANFIFINPYDCNTLLITILYMMQYESIMSEASDMIVAE
jgi:hypothetical protein